jgi:hypothetical protein
MKCFLTSLALYLATHMWINCVMCLPGDSLYFTGLDDSMRFASKNNQLNQVAHNLCNWIIDIFTSYFLIIPNNHFSLSLGVTPQLSKDFPWCHIFSLLLEWRLYRGIPSTYLRYWAERCHNAASYAGNLFKVLYILFTSIDVLQKSIV